MVTVLFTSGKSESSSVPVGLQSNTFIFWDMAGSSRCVYSNSCLRTAPQECLIPSPDAAPVQTRHPATFPFIMLISWEVKGSSTTSYYLWTVLLGQHLLFPCSSCQSHLVLFLSTEEPFGLQGLRNIYVLFPFN